MIPSEFIDELLNKIDVVDVIEEFVPLKKSGANYMACCPFHKEKSPSFSVSPSKQFYHCFGCGVHGSAIGFIMEYQGLSFQEAVQFLADRIGMTVPRQIGNSNSQAHKALKQQQQTLEQTTADAATFYQQQLKTSPSAQNYLQQRGLSDEIILHYGLGYAPDDWQALAKVFQPYPSNALVNSGMVITKDDRHYDRFRNRIMFPIRSTRGQIIGFGARILDSGEPKYLNSPETPLFDKGRNLYGLYEARAAIKEAQRVLVVEGYMDVVALAQFGLGYAVAALGTATTAEHVRLLMRQSDHIYFCFDGDSAGKKAAWRALENALPQLKDDKILHFLFLPAEHDPDSYVRSYGLKPFEDALLNQSLPLSAYFWQVLTENIDMDTQEGKAELIKTASPLLAQIKAPALSFLLRQELSQKVGIDEHNLAQLLGQELPRPQIIRQKSYQLPRNTFQQPPVMSLVQKQIRALLINPQWAVYIELPEYLDLHGDYACLAALAERIQASVTPLNSGAVLELMRNTEFEPVIRQIIHDYMDSPDVMQPGNEDDCTTFRQGMQKLLDNLKTQQIDALKRKLQHERLSADEKQLLLLLLSPSKMPSV
ncbi:DNA primase [Snodgrassella alvi]|uniref:DNA primase n=1 Tax=Snodgrassella alvi TaxID=1196083 RepID=UPI00352E94B3